MPIQVLRNNTIENDDWMKSLPGYKDEVAIHDQLAKAKEDATKSKRKKNCQKSEDKLSDDDRIN